MMKVLLAGDSMSYRRKRGAYAQRVQTMRPDWEIGILRQILGYFGNTMIWLDPNTLTDYCKRCYGTKPKYAKSLIKNSIPFDEWVVEPDYDVIHLNSGLHDIQEAQSPLTGEWGPIVPIEMYRDNLIYIVERILNKTDSKLIWASTTPVKTGRRRPIRNNDNVIAYNKVAAEVMNSYDIPINDLYGLVMEHGIGNCLSRGLHFNKYGSQVAAEQVIKYIEEIMELE